MAHGLGLSSAHNYYVNVDYPLEIDGLVLWLKYNTGYTSENNETSHKHDLDNDDAIKQWDDRSGDGNYVSQSSAADMPKYQISDGSLNWLTDSRWYDLNETIVIDDNEDFTLIMRVKFTSLSGAMFGHDTNNMFILTAADSFQVKIGGEGESNFTELGDVLQDGVFYTIMLVRSVGTDLNVYVNGGSYLDKQWGATQEDADLFTISNIGATADDTSELGGYVKDVLIYNGTALSGPQRLLMYDYLDGQLGTS